MTLLNQSVRSTESIRLCGTVLTKKCYCDGIVGKIRLVQSRVHICRTRSRGVMPKLGSNLWFVSEKSTDAQPSRHLRHQPHPKSSLRTRPKRSPNRFSTCGHKRSDYGPQNLKHCGAAGASVGATTKKCSIFCTRCRHWNCPLKKKPQLKRQRNCCPGKTWNEARGKSTPEVTRPDLTKGWCGRHARISNSKFTRLRKP